MNILFTCAGRRNYLINYFKQALNGQGTIFAADMQRTAPALVDADVAIQVPGIYDKNYISALVDIISQNKIDAIISLNDLELPILSKHQKNLENTGAKVIVSGEEVIKIAFDKWETVKFLERNNLKSPKTYIDYREAVTAINIEELKFPIVLKPRWGSASIGIEFAENLEEFQLIYKLLNIKLAKTILNKVSEEDIHHAILIQEKLGGQEYGMDVLNDFNGNYVGAFARKKLAMRAGETDKAISVIDNRITEVGKTIGENLNHIGNLDCDIFEYNGELYVLELNPRFGGGYPFSHEAGLDTPAIYLEWLKGGNEIARFINYKPGFMFSKCDRLIPIRQ